MVKYIESIKRPFTDVKKFIIGWLISLPRIIPFIGLLGGIFLNGYLLRVAKSVMSKKKKIPEMPGFENFLDMTAEGVMVLLIELIYMIPLIALLLISIAFGILSIPEHFTREKFLTFLASGGIVGMVLLFVFFCTVYFMLGAFLRFAETRKFREAFNISAITTKIFTTKFFLTTLNTLFIALIIGIPLAFTIVGIFFIPYLIGAIGATILGQAYAEA